MSEFTFLFRGRLSSASPEQMQQHFSQWVAWFQSLRESGQLKEPGHPLAPSGKLVQGQRKIVSDGPYAAATDVVGGYIVVEAAAIPHAVEISKGCPILEAGGSVEVRPVQQMRM